ncbi:MAG: glycosyltransferase family 2 protein [Myxococcaceae bacterium]
MPSSPADASLNEKSLDGVAVIVPALNEEGSISLVVSRLKKLGVKDVIVSDNGSTDETVRLAQAAGASVVPAPQKGYGAACLAGIHALPATGHIVVFCDGDGADDLSQLPALIAPLLDGRADLVIGSRSLGNAEPGALTAPQRAGNFVAALLLRILFGQRVTDLGPFRAVSRAALLKIGMRDPAFGWTAEMQTKALRLGLRVVEIPVNARTRHAGESKISGRLVPVFLAGWGILTTIVRYRFSAVTANQESA